MMKNINLFVVTTLLIIASCVKADDTANESQALTSPQQVSTQLDSKGGRSRFSCSPVPDCDEEISSYWLNLFIQQLLGQPQSEKEK